MIIKCPNCATLYKLEPKDLSTRGRPLECFDCKYRWLHFRNNKIKLIEKRDDAPVNPNYSDKIGLSSQKKQSTSETIGPNSLSALVFDELEKSFSNHNTKSSKEISDEAHQRIKEISKKIPYSIEDNVDSKGRDLLNEPEFNSNKKIKTNSTILGFLLVSFIMISGAFIYKNSNDLSKFNTTFEPYLTVYVETIDLIEKEIKSAILIVITKLTDL